MPFYDHVYGTMDKSTDSLYEKPLERKEESPTVVHLTHLTTPESICHLPIGFASFCLQAPDVEVVPLADVACDLLVHDYDLHPWPHLHRREKCLWEAQVTIMGNTEIHCTSKSCKHPLDIWLVGDGLSKGEQLKASKGTLFIPYSQFLPKIVRNDCLYHHTPAMVAPSSLANLNSCENWLPRRVMSASRVAGIVHALEGWNVNKCGQKMFDVEQVWEANLKHGFQSLMTPN